MIEGHQLRRLFPGLPDIDIWAGAINTVCPEYGINTPLRLAAFLAQTGHESQGFTALKENLNYNADALARTWPRRYAVDPKSKIKVPNDLAKKLQRQPEAIANNCYAGRMGNGPEESGDGWRYRGRGLIQLTGRANYVVFAEVCGRKLADLPAYLETPMGALESACWYWRIHGLTPLADNRDIIGITKIINGGTNGLKDRQQLYAKALTILNV